MNKDDLMERLKNVSSSVNYFTQIMQAKTVQKLLDIPIGPKEMISYFEAAEELGRIEEECIFYGKTVHQRLKEACPVKTKRHAFFM